MSTRYDHVVRTGRTPGWRQPNSNAGQIEFRRARKPHLDGTIADVDLLDVVRVVVPGPVRYPIAEKLAENRFRRRCLPGDIYRGGGRVVCDCCYRFSRRCWNG